MQKYIGPPNIDRNASAVTSTQVVKYIAKQINKQINITN